MISKKDTKFLKNLINKIGKTKTQKVPLPIPRSEAFPKPPPSRSSQLNMIEKLFGRFLRNN